MRSPLPLFGLAAVAAVACCIPLLHAEQCRNGYCPPTPPPVYQTPAAPETPVFVSPFTPLDVFVFVGQPAVVAPVAGPPPAAAVPPAGGTPDELPAGLPKARGYFGRPAAPPAPDLRAVAAALTSCAACHTAPSGKRGVNVFASDGSFAPLVAPEAILESVESDDMPLRGPKLTAAQKKTVEEWVASTKKGN